MDIEQIIEYWKNGVIGVMEVSEVGLPKIDVGLTKSYIKRVGVMPANGAEAAFRKQKSRISAGHLRDLSVVLRTQLVNYYPV